MNIALLQALGGLGGGGGIDAYIKSLNPVFYIKDLTQVVDGYFVDNSGNNKQIQAATTTVTNDSLIMPANDTDIIAALTAAGCYTYFYTNDLTPKTNKIGFLQSKYSNFLFFDKNSLVIFNGLTSVQVNNLYKKCKYLDYDYLNINLFKNFNYFDSVRTNVVQAGSNITFSSAKYAGTVYEDNTHSFSRTKKTIKCPITNSTAIVGLFSVLTTIFYNKFNFGFWLKKGCLPDATSRLQIKIMNYYGAIGTDTRLSNAVLYKGYTYGTATNGVFIDEEAGDYVHVRIKATVPYNVNNDSVVNVNFSISILSGPVGSSYDIEIIDLACFNNHNDIDLAVNYPGVEYISGKFIGKNIAFVGDSITVGGWGDLVAMMLGTKNNYNCGKSGCRMKYETDGTWIPFNRVAIAATNPDLFVILASANDTDVANLGTIDDAVTTTILGGYNFFLNYLTQNTTAEIVLVTQPPITTGADPKSIWETHFTNFATGVKALGQKYGLSVCDLHAKTSMTWDNSHIYLLDNVHWSKIMQLDSANIVAKHLIDNITL
jgi:hypothetical protein